MRYAETKSFGILMLTWFLIGLTTLGVQIVYHFMEFMALSATNMYYLVASDDPASIRLIFGAGADLTQVFHSAMVIWAGFSAIILLGVYMVLRRCKRYQRVVLAVFIPVATFGCVFLPFELADLIKGGFMSEYAEAKDLLKPEVNESGYVPKYKEFTIGLHYELIGDILGFLLVVILLIAKTAFIAAHALFFALAIPVLRERAGLHPKV
jgi:hypothetical protein